MNDIIEWTINHVRFKDLMKKNLVDYKILKHFIEFEFKDKNHTYYIYEEFSDDVLKEIKDWCTFVVLNKKKNVNFLTNNWESFVKNPKASIIFVHPKANQYWTLNPHVHNKISEKSKLKQGLMSLFDGVKEA